MFCTSGFFTLVLPLLSCALSCPSGDTVLCTFLLWHRYVLAICCSLSYCNFIALLAIWECVEYSIFGIIFIPATGQNHRQGHLVYNMPVPQEFVPTYIVLETFNPSQEVYFHSLNPLVAGVALHSLRPAPVFTSFGYFGASGRGLRPGPPAGASSRGLPSFL